MNIDLPIRTLLAESKTAEHNRNLNALNKNEKFLMLPPAHDGVNTVKLVQENEPKLLLMDLLLPQLDGLGVLGRLLEMPKEKHPVIILITPVISELILKEAFRLGAVYALSKPFSPSDMVDRIYSIYSIIKAKEESDQGMLITDDDIRPFIREWLSCFEIPTGKLGYRFLFLAIEYYILHYEKHVSFTKEVYPYIARVHNTTGSNVERSIRHALHRTWEKSEDKRKWASYLEREEYARSKAPSNGDFISGSTEKIIERMRETGIRMFYSH